MLNNIIQWSIKNRLIVVAVALLLLIYGGVMALRAPVDVFPDLTPFPACLQNEMARSRAWILR